MNVKRVTLYEQCGETETFTTRVTDLSGGGETNC